MSSRRIGLEIMAEMLQLCKRPQNKTRIMYEVNLSYGMLLKYLQPLQERELIIPYSATKYAVTLKGLDFLEKWTNLNSLLLPDVRVPSFIRA